MRIAALFALPLAAALAACGGSSAEEPKPARVDDRTVSAPALPSDADVVAKVYDPYYSVPEGFFTDARASTAQSYTMHHVLDDSGQYERCSDDFAEAEAWEAADNAARSVNGYYVGSVETPRYFEFVRELSYDEDIGNISDLTSPGFARVFKCSHTSRDGVDRSALEGYAGTLNVAPLSGDAVREFTEYLWQFAFFPQRHKKVLASYSASNGLGQTLLLGFASTQGSGQCDLIEIVEWQFVADTASGAVTSRFELKRSFRAELVSGSPRLCD